MKNHSRGRGIVVSFPSSGSSRGARRLEFDDCRDIGWGVLPVIEEGDAAPTDYEFARAREIEKALEAEHTIETERALTPPLLGNRLQVLALTDPGALYTIEQLVGLVVAMGPKSAAVLLDVAKRLVSKR